MKVVFMGSPDFAVPSLEALIEARFDVQLVVTQPDRRAGRGRKMLPTAVKATAGEHHLPCIDFGKGQGKAVSAQVMALEPDAVVVAAFGHILREPLLTVPRFGCINVHASLLPRWRGVSPVQYSILHGDSWTGVTIMQMDAGVDTGPILAQRSVAIGPEDTGGELLVRLAGQGADLLIDTLRGLENGRIEPVAQGAEGAVYAPKLTRALSAVRWDRDVVTVHNQIRSLIPWPGTTTYLGEKTLKITEARPMSFNSLGRAPGTVVGLISEGVVVACGEGSLLLTGLQCPGRKPLPVDEFLRGFQISVGGRVPLMKADPVRRRAHEILIAVEGGESLDSELAEGLNQTTDARDRAFLAELVLGTVQWQGRYDHLIQRFSRKKAPDDVATLTLLRLSLHQMIGQQTVPAYAAIHQAGELCRLQPGKQKMPFVNGLLQSVNREKNLRSFFETPGADKSAELAAWQSHPGWLVKKWVAQFGWDKTEAICTWNNRPVPLVFHVLAPVDPVAAVEELTGAGCPVTSGSTDRTLVADQRLGRKLLDEILNRFPWLIVQDPTVQEATAWLADRVPGEMISGDLPVLDMCAAPGGKTAFLAANWPSSGRIVAMDPHPERIRMLTATMKRIETNRVDVLLADGNQVPFGPGKFGAVLLDGPCSGTGVLRHHPEGRWRLKMNVPARKGVKLSRLAGHAADLLAPGGLLMYATCSIESEENEEVVERLLAERSDLTPAPDDEGRWRRLWLPGDMAGDGFFAARLRKNA